MNELDMQRADKLVEWLNEKYTEYIVKERVRSQRVPSQNNFAIYCGVSTSNMSAWMNKHRLPAGENLDRLATKLGLEIYDILNIPPRLPKDKWLLKIARQWHM